jgi:hypothetical protein
MAARSVLIFSALAALAACETTVVGGGGEGGAGGGDGAVVTTASTGETTGTPASTSSSATTAPSTGVGGAVAQDSGVVVPDDEDRVQIRLGNFAQACDAPQADPPCAPGDWWLATIVMPRGYLTPGQYPLFTADVSIGLHETFDECSGEGFAGWDGEPASITVDSVDATHLVVTIEGAYTEVDGTWDVPLCAGVTPP